MRMFRQTPEVGRKAWLFLLALVSILYAGFPAAYAEDIILSGVYEAALDLPRIYFLLKRDPQTASLPRSEDVEAHYAFLDTGASGILLSKETADLFGVQADPKARFFDVGVGGREVFHVSEPLYVGLAGFETSNPQAEAAYRYLGPGRLQIKTQSAGFLQEALDIIGMPMLMGRIVVLHAGATNELGYFAAEVRDPGDSRLPKMACEVPLRFVKFFQLADPNNIPPLPTLTCNPVIDHILLTYRDKQTRGDWLLDTGATVSFISVKQAQLLGLVDEKGTPLKKPDFSLPMGGIGNMIQISGFEIDRLAVPTSSGSHLIFTKARIGVHDIEYFDEDKGQRAVLDGVFGSNFLCASAKMEGLLPSEIGQTVFNYIVLDLQKGWIGFNLTKDSPATP